MQNNMLSLKLQLSGQTMKHPTLFSVTPKCERA